MPDPERSPSFFIAGVTKGGTSSLHRWLMQHPDIAMPEEKELHYFCRCPARLRSIDSDHDYLARFADLAPSMAKGEASPCYSFYPTAVARMAEWLPQAKVILSLRDPVDRFWSHHLMNSWYHPDYPTPEQVIERWERGEEPDQAVDGLVAGGMYATQVERVWRSFGRDSGLILFLEETTDDPQRHLDRVTDLLGLARHRFDTSVRDKAYAEPRSRAAGAILKSPLARKVGIRIVPPRVRRFVKYRVLGDVGRKPPLSPELDRRLTQIYRPDVARLEDLIGRPVPWTRFSASATTPS